MTLHQLVVRCFAALSSWAIHHPKTTLTLGLAVTLAAAPGVARLKLRTDGHALVDESAPEVVYDKSVRRQFGIEDQIVVLIRSPHEDGIFNPGTVQLVRDLTTNFMRLPGVNPANVTSLATEPTFRVRPGTLTRQTLLEPPLRAKAELDLLRDDLRRIELYTGTIVSFDGRSTCILIGAPADGDRTQLYQRMLDVIAARGPVPEEIAVTGAPVAEALLGIHILEDLGVPQRLLGTSTRARPEQAGWRLPRSFYELRLLIARNIGLVPIAVLVMVLVFYASFRNPLTALLPLPEIGASLVFVFGLMGYGGVPIYLTIAVMPVLLVAMCVTDEIHVFSRYLALLREQPGAGPGALAQATMDEMVCPVANTSLTTAIGFVSFAFSPLGPVQAFGIFTAIGVLFCLVWSLTVIPAMLVLLPPAWLVTRRRGQPARDAGAAAPWFGRLALAVVRRRALVLGAVAVVAALTPFGLRRLVVQDSWIDGFDRASEFSRATRLVNEQFHGMHLLFVCAEADRVLRGELEPRAIAASQFLLPTNLVANPAELGGAQFAVLIWTNPPAASGSNAPPSVWRSHIEMTSRVLGHIVVRTPQKDWLSSVWLDLPKAKRIGFEITAQPHLNPQMLRTLDDLAVFLRQRRERRVGGVIGPTDFVTTTRFMVRPTDPQARVLPSAAGEIKLMWDYYRMVRGPERLRQVVTTNYARSLTTVFLKEANFQDTAALLRDLAAFERERLAAAGVKLGFAGDVAVSQSLIRGIVTTQLQSLFWSLVGIYAVTSLLGRSLRWGIYCVLPSALAVVINFAVMGWCGIPLGVATSMFAGMTLGIGVDFAIHALEGFARARAANTSLTDALSAAMARTGPAVLINTLSIALGFGVLMLSQVPANARLGLLVVLGLVDCLIATLLLLPVLLHRWPLKEAPVVRCEG